MKHARQDYDRIQDNSTAIALAQLVMSMSFISDTGLTARSLARQVLRQARIYSDQTAVVTNGTVRCIPANEPVFLVRGQDAVGAATVRAWADLAETAGAKPDILAVARAHATKMEAWAIKKTPDLPSDPASMPGEAAPAGYRVGFTIPEGLHPNTATLVRDFAEAMAKKLRASEIKRGWTANWMRKDWQGELAAELLRHVHKGDPIDVAAYAAFAWFHGWSVAPAEASATSGGQGWRYFNDDRVRLSDGTFGIVTGRGRDGLLRIRPETKPDWTIGDLTSAGDDDLDAWRGAPAPLEFGYTNWRGEFGQRRVQPLRLYFGSTEWHPEPQWLLEAADLDKGEARAFAFKDIAPAYDPLRRIDYPEGRFGPAMLDGDDEMTGKELKLIAKSHGFNLRLKVEEWEGEAGEIIERGGSFAEALEATCLLQVDKDGYQLVGAWDSEDGDLVIAYVRPLVVDAKPEGSANG